MSRRLTKADYSKARLLARDSRRLSIGLLVNRMRISSVDAEKILRKLQKEQVVDAQGNRIKNSKEQA